uniref:Uncharacterized protein n=1 Tax=Cannabis sativa TaxID=3483 RepID=A0A803R8I9_CANSA
MDLYVATTAPLLSSPTPSLPLHSSTPRVSYRPLSFFTFGKHSNWSKLTYMDSQLTPRASRNDDNGSTLITSHIDSGSETRTGEVKMVTKETNVSVKINFLELMLMLDLAGKNSHHIIEATFKAFAMAIRQATGSFANMSDKSCHVVIPSQEVPLNSRRALVCGVASVLAIINFNCGSVPSMAWAEDKSTEQEEEDNAGVIGAIKSLFDPNEKTKSGKELPKGYLKSAREVVKNLRESLKEDPKDNAKFRRTADAAKESIREYLSNWRGQQAVAQEESYVVLEKAIRSLASFYSKAGPSAAMPEDVKSEILNDLDTAEESL